MGSSQPQMQTLIKRSSDSLLMPPPRPLKRQKRPAKVLDEDVYSEALSHIIARDFFPGLLETEAQREYLEALESKDNNWIREAGSKLTQVMTPMPTGQRRAGRGTTFTPRRKDMAGDTPRTFFGETPGRTPANSDFAPEERSEVDVNMSLGAFQAKYTSEDNESFNDLLDKQNAKHAAKYLFLQDGNNIPSARLIAHRARERKRLENGNKATSTALVAVSRAGTGSAAVSSEQCPGDLDTRPASIDNFPNQQGARNHFMFGPEGVEDSIITRAQQAEQSSNAPPKAVQYSATRFPALKPESTVPASPSISAIDAAIAGQPRPTESEPGYTGAETPRVNGYAFVDAESTPGDFGTPVTDEEADAARTEALRQLLPEVDKDGPNHFQLAGRSRREDLHYKLVEKLDAGRRRGGRVDQLRNLGITPGRTPTPKFTSGAGLKSRGVMTPAAQKLAESIKTPKRDGGLPSPAFAKKLNWTPTPRTRKT